MNIIQHHPRHRVCSNAKHRSGPRQGLATAIAFFIVASTTFVSGCNSTGSGPYQSQSESARNPLEAQRLTLKAADILDAGNGDLETAEKLLRDALTADIYHGPAHNNLGVVYLKSDPPKLYEAASEFEWARKLMPGHPDPRTNLAMTLERAGRTDEAIATYRTALDVFPDHIQSMQGLSRLQIRTGRADDQTPKMLKEIAMRGTTEKWREWARVQMAKQ